MIDQTSSRGANDDAPPASSRQRAIETYEGAKDRASDALGQAPLLALAGGIAAGALIAALLPRTETEARLVRPTARRVKDSARAAYEAARNTGSDHLDQMGLNREKGEETVRNLADGLIDAAKASANAAVDAVKNKR
jgi:hypothetical protein